MDDENSTPAVDDHRADLAAAFDAVEGGDDATPTEQPAPAQSPAPAPAQSAERGANQGAPAPERGGKGLTAGPRQGPTGTPAPDQGSAKTAGQGLNPPQSWKPEAREQWSKLPPQVQSEVWRVENAVRATLRDAKQAREFTQAFAQVTRPYEALIRQDGGNPLETFGNYLQTVHSLRTGTPSEKATTFAGLAKMFAVDVGMLDMALAAAGFAPPIPGQPQQPQQQFQDPRVDKILQAMQQGEQQRQQGMVREVAGELAHFEEGHEFLEDVRNDMADLLELAARQGVELSLDDAYKRACRINENVSRVITQRELEATADAQRKNAARARGASLSVSGAPTIPDGAPGGDGTRRGDIEAAINQLSGR